uniref:Uncharacterized protein n=1 Tax=Romanomermis culicivorax TaxID=13658 RepID=A0A915KBW5_ROMCU
MDARRSLIKLSNSSEWISISLSYALNHISMLQSYFGARLTLALNVIGAKVEGLLYFAVRCRTAPH